MTSQVVLVVRNLPANVQTLGWEDPPEKEIATHSNILVWRTPWTEEPSRLYNSWGCKGSDTHEHTHILIDR